MSDPIDLLQIKIDKAKSELPKATREAIEAVDWKAAILGMRASKGYSFEQLGDLELETELLLAGLVSPENYPRELESRMRISRAQADGLVEEMNQLVFSKIREELIKNSEREEVFAKKASSVAPLGQTTELEKEHIQKEELDILHQAGIKIVSGNEPKGVDEKKKIDLKIPKITPGAIHPAFAQKLSSNVQSPTVKTEHVDINVKVDAPTATKSYPKGGDPYRMMPE
jgi:hypothetical protein